MQVVTGYGPAGAALIDSGISSSLSPAGVSTGKRVAGACGERLIPCVMELGGKAPLIACADADIERTAKGIVFGGFSNAGQVCLSVERVYAHREIHDQLVDRVVSLTKELRIGDPTTDIVDIGAIIFPIRSTWPRSTSPTPSPRGAELRAGGKRVPGKGQFFEPTVLTNCDHTMTVMTEEIFGPIVPIMRVSSEEEAVRLSNESHLGLNAYVFSNDRDHARRLAERIEAGTVLINDVLSNGGITEAPFGGIKQSGFGRVMGDESLREMCNPKHINVDRMKAGGDLIWFPYTQKSYDWFKKGMRVLFSGGSLLSRIAELF